MMGVRSGRILRSYKEAAQDIRKPLVRAYVLWLMGLFIGLVGIQPSGFSAAGISLKIERPEAIQGFTYIASLAYCFVTMLLVGVSNIITGPSALRLGVFCNLPQGRRSVLAASRDELRRMKQRIKSEIRRKYTIVLAMALFPAAMILIFSRGQLRTAADVLLQSLSD
jgi:hypothetical protein